MPGDGQWPRIEAQGGELGAQGDDPLAHGVGRVARVGQGSAGTWLEGLEPTVAVAADQAGELLPTDPVLDGGGGDG